MNVPFLYAVFLAPYYMNSPDVRGEEKLRQDQDGFWLTKISRGQQNSMTGTL